MLPGNILFGIEEYDVEQLVRDRSALFRESWRWGWPSLDYRGDLQVLIRLLNAAGARAFEVSSSAGMSGWVIAGTLELLTRDAAATVA